MPRHQGALYTVPPERVSSPKWLRLPEAHHLLSLHSGNRARPPKHGIKLHLYLLNPPSSTKKWSPLQKHWVRSSTVGIQDLKKKEKKKKKKKRKIQPGASKLILPKQFGGQTFPQMKTAVHLLISLKLFHVIFISF